MIADDNAMAMLAAEIAQVQERLAWLQKIRDALCPPPIAPDACYADCISPDVPPGHDTILGHLARQHPDVLDLIDPGNPDNTLRDGLALSHATRRAGLDKVYVDAPPVLQREGISTVRAYPVELLQQRWR